MLRWIYTGLGYCILPLALMKLLWRSRHTKAYRHHWNERFGFVKKESENPVIWVHAVSVGETIGMKPLIDELIRHYPNHRLWITNGTITGRARTEALFANQVSKSYAPYDTPSCINRFLDVLKPSLVLIMETEVWPNWMHALKIRRIPVVLVNARLSKKSLRRYQIFAFLFRAAWQSFNQILAQAPADAERIRVLDVDPARVHVVGNLKFNLTLPKDFDQQVQRWRPVLPNAPIWVTASTHPTEEEMLLPVFKAIKAKYPRALWILVPRHPERTSSITRLLTQAELSFTLRSAYAVDSATPIVTDVLVVDIIGELLLFYALAQVTFVGGSYVPIGGHNILEAAAVGPVITCGPIMFNFATIFEQFQQRHALICCPTIHDLIQKTLLLFEDPALRLQYSEVAKQCFIEQQHALESHMKYITPLLTYG